MSEALILVTQHSLPYGFAYLTYEWVGKKTDKVFVYKNLTADKLFTGFPWKLVEIEQDIARRGSWYVRSDVGFGIPAIITMAKVLTDHTWKWVKYRMIATLWIWGIIKDPTGKAV